ncbi:MAG: ATP-binding cassette domain-containing protein, partial [Candidatus Latescibacterota bacterium]
MISLEAVTVCLPPGKAHARTILKEISFSVRSGEKIAVTGSNGSGKTTLLQTIAGLLSPVSGSITVKKSATSPRGRATPPSISLLLQEPDNQFVASSVHNELLLGLRGANDRRAKDNRCVQSAVERFDLTDLLERNPHRLSGGEKQRLAFATIWLADPDILLLDEPTTYLDAPSRRRCFEFIDMMCSDESAVVWATPGGEDLLRVDRVLWLDDGSIRFCGVVKDLFEDGPRAEQSGVVPPPIMTLSSQLLGSSSGRNADRSLLEPDGDAAGGSVASTRVNRLAGLVLSSSHFAMKRMDSRSGLCERARSCGETSPFAPSETILAAFDDVSFAYDACKAIQNISMKIYQGQCVGIAGLNGSGKSTLL